MVKIYEFILYTGYQEDSEMEHIFLFLIICLKIAKFGDNIVECK